MAGKSTESGCATVVGVFVLGIGALIATMPKTAWIVIGIVVGGLVFFGVLIKTISAIQKSLAAANERSAMQVAAQVAALEREEEEYERDKKQQRINVLGATNAARVDRVGAVVEQITSSEAARTGWLGDIDFAGDLQAITENFEKAHALREVAAQLSTLDKRSDDDRKILAEATATAAKLERVAIELVELVDKCAAEARFIDKSLRIERQDARTAEQRAELHARLSALLYGVEVTPNNGRRDSVAEAVLARVQAYREVKNQMKRICD